MDKHWTKTTRSSFQLTQQWKLELERTLMSHPQKKVMVRAKLFSLKFRMVNKEELGKPTLTLRTETPRRGIPQAKLTSLQLEMEAKMTKARNTLPHRRQVVHLKLILLRLLQTLLILPLLLQRLPFPRHRLRQHQPQRFLPVSQLFSKVQQQVL